MNRRTPIAANMSHRDIIINLGNVGPEGLIQFATGTQRIREYQVLDADDRVLMSGTVTENGSIHSPLLQLVGMGMDSPGPVRVRIIDDGSRARA